MILELNKIFELLDLEFDSIYSEPNSSILQVELE